VDIEYVQDGGGSQTEHHLVTFVQGDGGQLLMDSDVAAG
jgi:hypothetical protein